MADENEIKFLDALAAACVKGNKAKDLQASWEAAVELIKARDDLIQAQKGHREVELARASKLVSDWREMVNLVS